MATKDDWVKITAIVPAEAYWLLERARESVFRTTDRLPDNEATSWGVVFAALGGDYLQGTMPGWRFARFMQQPERSIINSRELYEIMAKTRGLNPATLHDDPEKVWRKLEQLCQQLATDPLDFPVLAKDFVAWYEATYPEKARVRQLEERTQELERELKALRAAKLNTPDTPPSQDRSRTPPATTPLGDNYRDSEP